MKRFFRVKAAGENFLTSPNLKLELDPLNYTKIPETLVGFPYPRGPKGPKSHVLGLRIVVL